MSMSFLGACMPMHHIHAWCPQKPQVGVGFPETGVTHG